MNINPLEIQGNMEILHPIKKLRKPYSVLDVCPLTQNRDIKGETS